MHKHLIDKGVTFDQNLHSVGQTATHDVWMAFLRDVDDNTLAIMTEYPLDKTPERGINMTQEMTIEREFLIACHGNLERTKEILEANS